MNGYAEHSTGFAPEDLPPQSDGLHGKFSVNLEGLYENAERITGGVGMEAILAWFKHAWEFVVSHHEEIEHTEQLAETIVKPFLKSGKAKDALALADSIKSKVNDALAAEHDREQAAQSDTPAAQ